MLLQCFAAGGSLFLLAFRPPWLERPLDVCVWAAVGLTLYSGVAYIRRAIRMAKPKRPAAMLILALLLGGSILVCVYSSADDASNIERRSTSSRDRPAVGRH